ncbi:hypothetical protein GCM10011376_39010 [Nocardioides flavus (ex Wang et al. 2016)]|uniref:Uncharacterized protein n=1 Tax=Nocardioides flavus (ex Wang et al. 2016) TaxID=2058780 RepID=A0ABQ3HRK0_9ACTN|nr:hypothetical protein [Nocardioides flavus (ex Wang et al. 2016)]GHE19291.1 hypothetical protein GCM10011376_39010 [Nocardioides flavus (ex Wang et al. 2016)]
MRRAQLGQAAGTAIGVAAGTLALWFAIDGAGAEPEVPTTGPLPVITPETPWESLPAAEVEGRLTMRDGCLLLDSEIVFWEHGTRWDPESEAVVLDNDDTVGLGEDFVGGGGHFDLRGDDSGPLDVRSWLGRDPGRSIESCSGATGITALVLAYSPDEG